jgi:probable F420-dependent oxidoreductase
MAHPRPFRFGIQLSTAPSGAAWADLARKAEDLGYAALYLPDHFGDQLAPVPAMMAAADATTTLKVGTLVFDNDYKHPVVLAKEMATIDALTGGGRLEVGIGAGWMASDYDQSGIPMDRPGVRVDRMMEGVAVLKGCWGTGPFSFKGEHYVITDYDGKPDPTQPLPLLIGGGAQRMLTFAGQEADIVGINPSIHSGQVDAAAAQTGVASETDKKIEWVRAGAGDRYADVEIQLLQFAAIVTDDAKGTAEMMAPLFGLPPEELETYPHACIGTTEEIVESLQRRRERWDASYIVFQGDMDSMAPVVAALRDQ